MLAKLADLGIFIDADEVFALVKEGSAGRPHIAQAMVHRGYVRSVREAFDRYLHSGGPASTVGDARHSRQHGYPHDAHVAIASSNWCRSHRASPMSPAFFLRSCPSVRKGQLFDHGADASFRGRRPA